MGAAAYDDMKEQAGTVEVPKAPIEQPPAVAPTTEPTGTPAEAPTPVAGQGGK